MERAGPRAGEVTIAGADRGADFSGSSVSSAGMDAELGAACSTGASHASAPAGLADGLPLEGLSWSWDHDLDGLLAAVSEPAPWTRGTRPSESAAAPASSAAAGSAPETGHATEPAPKAEPRTGAEPATEAKPTTEPETAAVAEPVTGGESAANCDAAAGVDPVEAELAEYLEAVEAGRCGVLPLGTVVGRVAESLPPGPELAGWAAAGAVGDLEDGALAGMAAYRRLASWAQAGELAVVAELASRSAAADAKVGVDEADSPARVPEEACAQVSLGLTMSQCGASWWADLAVTLRWRLVATGAALRSGAIDLGRARQIAEATAGLDDATARKVEARVLAGAGTRRPGSCGPRCGGR